MLLDREIYILCGVENFSRGYIEDRMTVVCGGKVLTLVSLYRGNEFLRFARFMSV
jgi:hypothetical protein